MEVKDLQVPSGVVCVRCGDNRCVPCNIHLGDGYVVKDVVLWKDMIRAIGDLGKDVRNRKYVCPENLKEAHDYWCGMLERKKKKKKE